MGALLHIIYRVITMQKIRAVLLLCLIAVLAVSTVSWSVFSAARFSFTLTEAEAPTVSLPSASDTKAEESAPPAESEPQPPVAEEKTESAIPTVENHTVSGKIITKTIDPKSATLSYGGVYLKNNTGTAVSIKNELEQNFSLKLSDTAEPQVLILHTHATESYMLENRDYYTTSDASRSTDKQKNMAAVGEKITAELKKAGIAVIHDTTLHDYPSYSGSYNQSAKTINKYLKEYPSIKVVLDVHRDAVGGGGNDKAKLVAKVNGKTAAQVMLVMGSQTGTVKDHPNWKQNLRLAMRFHKKIEEKYPSLARPLLLASKKYNQDLSSGAMLIEVGTDANTLDEALYSAELVGKALGELLTDLK